MNDYTLCWSDGNNDDLAAAAAAADDDDDDDSGQFYSAVCITPIMVSTLRFINSTAAAVTATTTTKCRHKTSKNNIYI